MKKFSALAVAAALCACVSSAQAEDVAQAQLSALGLGGMEVMTEAEGLQVRGKSSSAQVTGLAVFSFVSTNPLNGDLLTLGASSFGRATAENAGLQVTTTAQSPAALAVGLGSPVALDTAINGDTFSLNLGAFTLLSQSGLVAGQ